jgi:hypothetical protein
VGIENDLLEIVGELTELTPEPELGEFYKFNRDIVGATHKEVLMLPETHTEPCQKLEAILGDCKFNGPSQQLFMYLDPRNSLKTTIGVEGVVLYALTRNPDIRTFITSADDRSSVKRLQAIGNHLAYNPAFHNAYGDDWKPEFRTDNWNRHALTVTRRKKIDRDPSVSAASVGTNMVGSHFDLIIVDDAVTELNSISQSQRDRVYEYIAYLLPILEPGGVMIVIGTRWHTDDAYGRLIRVDEERVRDGLAPEWGKVIRGAYLEDGSLLYPTRLTHDFLDAQLRRLGARRFAGQYLNQPISDEDKTFSMEFLHEREFSHLYDPTTGYGLLRCNDGGQYPVDVCLMWDPTGKRVTKSSDFHGITVVGCDPQNRWWVCEADEKKGTPTYIINHICNLISRYHVRAVGMEDLGSQALWWDLLKIELDRRALKVSYIPVSHGGLPKSARIESLQPKWEAREIILKPQQRALRQQFDNFTPASDMDHDDIIDSLAYTTKVVRKAPEIGKVTGNPIDPEWVERQKRQPERDTPRAGGLGSLWG